MFLLFHTFPSSPFPFIFPLRTQDIHVRVYNDMSGMNVEAKRAYLSKKGFKDQETIQSSTAPDQ